MHSNFFCKSSHLNLYKKPSYKSKISSQILFGEKFKILFKKKIFLKLKIHMINMWDILNHPTMLIILSQRIK